MGKIPWPVWSREQETSARSLTESQILETGGQSQNSGWRLPETNRKTVSLREINNKSGHTSLMDNAVVAALTSRRRCLSAGLSVSLSARVDRAEHQSCTSSSGCWTKHKHFKNDDFFTMCLQTVNLREKNVPFSHKKWLDFPIQKAQRN